jgi:hypothetical protein
MDYIEELKISCRANCVTLTQNGDILFLSCKEDTPGLGRRGALTRHIMAILALDPGAILRMVETKNADITDEKDMFGDKGWIDAEIICPNASDVMDALAS